MSFFRNARMILNTLPWTLASSSPLSIYLTMASHPQLISDETFRETIEEQSINIWMVLLPVSDAPSNGTRSLGFQRNFLHIFHAQRWVHHKSPQLLLPISLHSAEFITSHHSSYSLYPCTARRSSQVTRAPTTNIPAQLWIHHKSPQLLLPISLHR